jgi:hypothetical protein
MTQTKGGGLGRRGKPPVLQDDYVVTNQLLNAEKLSDLETVP